MSQFQTLWLQNNSDLKVDKKYKQRKKTICGETKTITIRSINFNYLQLIWLKSRYTEIYGLFYKTPFYLRDTIESGLL